MLHKLIHSGHLAHILGGLEPESKIFKRTWLLHVNNPGDYPRIHVNNPGGYPCTYVNNPGGYPGIHMNNPGGYSSIHVNNPGVIQTYT